MKENEIKVSIACIAYNQEKYIETAIKSFLMQKTNFNYEILIHDDASTDRTAEIIKKYEEKYPDIIKPIYQKENQYSKGIRRVFNNNFERALGKYIALCEGDDYWIDPYKLQKQYDYMEKNPECGLCFHSVYKLNDLTNKIVGSISPGKDNQKFSCSEVILGGGGFMGTNSIFFKTSVIKNFPKFYNESPVGDYPLQILASSENYAYFFKEVMSVYRVNVKGSWSVKNEGISLEEKNNNNVILNKKLIKMLEEYNEYSNKKYKEAVLYRIKEIEFENLIINKNLKLIKSERYKEIYNKLKVKQKLKLYLKLIFPNIYYFLYKLKKGY